MRFKNNKGYTGIDISIAMIIILTFVPTIFGVIYNIQKLNAKATRKEEAVSIAVEVIETAKQTSYSGLSINNDSGFLNALTSKGYSSYTNNDFQEQGHTYKYLQKIKDSSGKETHYQVQVEIENYYPQDLEEDNRQDLLKNLSVKVLYTVGKKIESIDMETFIQNI